MKRLLIISVLPVLIVSCFVLSQLQTNCSAGFQPVENGRVGIPETNIEYVYVPDQQWIVLAENDVAMDYLLITEDDGAVFGYELENQVVVQTIFVLENELLCYRQDTITLQEWYEGGKEGSSL